ncbi:MAG: hypothetical protein CBE09_00310 [Rhizobiales bacterium TMED249]|nr:MAG: hypothetical protein CBE09_00310 [Rhizobiales bacterium TMED249]|tara:strand:+ start:284 stop:1270 length:987 start_codon:yes stop_codon:yes gene_type:complete
MKRLLLCLTSLSLVLTGCSYVSGVEDFFDKDQNKQDANEFAAKAAKTAAENSENPEAAVTDLALQEGSTRLSDSLTSRLTSDTSKTKVTVLSQKSEKTSVTVSNVTALGPIDTNSVSFIQSSLLYKPKRSTLNLGLGRRQLSQDEKTMFGLNAFLDYAPKYGHQRASVGAEVKSRAFELTANQYFRISGWNEGENGNQERAYDGTEIELGAQVPYIPSARLFAKSWEWSGKSKTKGKTYSIEVNEILGPGLTLNAGVKDYDGSKKNESFASLRYSLRLGDDDMADAPKSFISDEAFASGSMRSKLLEEVRRTNEIKVEAEFTTGTGGV